MNPFGRRRPDVAKIRQIKEWVRARLDLSPDAQVLVVELACAEPGCPPIETAITVLLAGGGKLLRKAHLAVAEVDEAEIDRIWSRPEPHEEVADAPHHGR